MVRRKKNHTEFLQDHDGNWVTKPNVLEDMATDFFLDLYTDDVGEEPYVLQGCFPTLDPNDIDTLSKRVNYQQIKKPIFDIESFKAPRKDGFQAIFY